MIDQQRAHTYGRSCWCNPLVVTAGTRVLMPVTGTVVSYEPIAANQMAVHIEPRLEPTEDDE